MSLTISETLSPENVLIQINERQTKKKIRLEWDSLPEGAKILLHYGNGAYIGVERVEEDGEYKINIVYSSRVTLTEKGETIFGAYSKETEKNIAKYENKLE